MNFEAHITIPGEHAEALQTTVCPQLRDWKFSRIQGDPDLGDKTFCYLTMHHSDLATVQVLMRMAVDKLCSFGCHPIRKKIELIIHDERI